MLEVLRRSILFVAFLSASLAQAGANGPIIWNGANSRDLSASGLVTPGLSVTGTSSFTGLGTFAAGLKPSTTSSTLNAYTSWTTVAFNAANYTASAGNWTVDSGDQVTLKYMIINNLMTMMVNVQSTDVSSTPNYLILAIPASKTTAAEVGGAINILDASAGTFTQGHWYVPSGSTSIRFYKANTSSNWTTTAGDNSGVSGVISFEIN